MNGKMTPGPTRDNQATLGNGCVCASGCPACDTLAEAWGAMVKALQYAKGWVGVNDSDTSTKIRAALTIARRVTYRGQDQTRYADHTKHGAGWKDPSKGYGGPR